MVTALIASVDTVEWLSRSIWRGLRRLVPRHGLGLTGALLWRGAAALAGIGMTAALVTGLSAKDEDQTQLAALTVQDAARTGGPADRQATTGPIQWAPIVKPIAMFNLDAPEFARAAPAYAARSGSGAREDLLSFGGFAQATPHLALAVRTGRLDGANAAPFTVAIAREAAAMALSTTRSSLPVTIETRFGPLETADVVLSDGTESRGCVAFRSAGGIDTFALRGWWCAAGKPSDRRQLTCLVERLDLINAAGDQALRAAFAASELRRNAACERAHLSAAGRKASWLDAEAPAPALKIKTATAEASRALPIAREKAAKPRGRKAQRAGAST